MGEGEGEVLGHELLHVRTLDIIGLLELVDAEDLVIHVSRRSASGIGSGNRTWMDLKRERWRAAMSWYRASTASVRVRARSSLYMLWVPERES